jgi:hypothetical protein
VTWLDAGKAAIVIAVGLLGLLAWLAVTGGL